MNDKIITYIKMFGFVVSQQTNTICYKYRKKVIKPISINVNKYNTLHILRFDPKILFSI